MTVSKTIQASFLILDSSLLVIDAKDKSLQGKSFIELCVQPDADLFERLLSLPKHSYKQYHLTLSLEKNTPQRFLVMVRKGKEKFTVSLINLEPIYQLHEDIALFREVAYVDNLTGALNRHGYYASLFDLFKSSEQFGYNIGIIFVDVDNMKEMNTRYGYLGGDEQIVEVASVLKKTLRKNDVLARVGGDEYLAILPMRSTDKHLLEQIAKRILQNIKENKVMKTTVSLGLYFMKAEEITTLLRKRDTKKAWELYLQKVDSQLQKAKNSGKNTYKIL